MADTEPETVTDSIALAISEMADTPRMAGDALPWMLVMHDDEIPRWLDRDIYEVVDFRECEGGECHLNMLTGRDQTGIGIIEGISGQRTCDGVFCIHCVRPCHRDCGPWD